ncbi:hypothetical protein [uncultured Flavobacterium sp.]|uniref:hypothetical protein n=1 Tax=uncultured Flavobacterium sp. TaxID=165435 RepID=UPI0025F0039F|nr:hypothetical protein [uncultured Flavobacterium sp.]
MKKIYLLLLFVTCSMMAQIPQGFSYQAVALNTSGNPVASSPVSVRLSILEGSATGEASYVELHNPTTNNVGLFTLTIGQGTPQTGTFAGVNWALTSKFLKVEIDVANGSNYITVGSSQLLSVPYAMYAGAIAGVDPGTNPGTGTGPGDELTQLFLYGTFNSFNASTSLPMVYTGNGFYGYKYLAAGTQLKFLTSQNATSAYGNGGGNVLAQNGNPFVVNSSGIYYISAEGYEGGDGEWQYNISISNVSVKVDPQYGSSQESMTYNAGTNTLSCTLYIGGTVQNDYRKFMFTIGSQTFGDNLADGFIDSNGDWIEMPLGENILNITLNLNFSGEGSPYTVTPQ